MYAIEIYIGSESQRLASSINFNYRERATLTSKSSTWNNQSFPECEGRKTGVFGLIGGVLAGTWSLEMLYRVSS